MRVAWTQLLLVIYLMKMFSSQYVFCYSWYEELFTDQVAVLILNFFFTYT